MHALPRTNASMKWFLEDLTYRIVAKSGNPSDRHHIGKIIQQSLMDDPHFIAQIDGSTGTKESGGSVLRRSTKCAIALQRFGLKRGDVITLMAPNHLDVSIVFYAALYLGVATAPIDINLGAKEIEALLLIMKPQAVFCQSNHVRNVAEAISNAKVTSKIITFNKNQQCIDFSSFLEKYGDDTKIKKFKPTDFDPLETIAFLMMTSGTSGVPKCAAVTHVNSLYGCTELWSREYKFPDPKRMALILSPIQWLSANFHYLLSPILRYTRLQSPLPVERRHVYDMINKYRPTHMIASPPLALSLLKTEEVKNCELSCFTSFLIGGSAVAKEVVDIAKKILPQADVIVQYGQTEVSGIIIHVDNHPPGSLGRIVETLQFRLIDPITQEDIVEPNKTGELWLKGPAVFKGYYNDPERTKEVLTEDGWLKTGDLMYMDKYLNMYFVDRMKMLLKYRNHHVSPVELESVSTLRHEHPGVYDVAVTGIDDLECGDLPVACVVRRPGHNVTAQEIKDLVKNTLAETKQLRGGVVFMDQLPTTATSKVDRVKLKNIVTQLEREQ